MKRAALASAVATGHAPLDRGRFPPERRPAASQACQAFERRLLAFVAENVNFALEQYAWEEEEEERGRGGENGGCAEGGGGGDLGFPSARHCAQAASGRDPELLAAIGLLTHASQVGKTVLRAQAARGLATVAVRSPEPYRLACYGALRASRGAALPCTADAALRVLDGLYEARELARRAVQEEQGGAGGAGGLSDARKRELTELHHALLRRVQCLCPVPETLYRPLGAECSRLLPELAQPPTPGSGPGPDAEGPASAEGGRAGAGSGAGAGRAAGAGAAPDPPFTPDWATSGEWAGLGGQDSGVGFDFGSFGDRDKGEGGAFRADAPPDGPPEGPGPGIASPEPPPPRKVLARYDFIAEAAGELSLRAGAPGYAYEVEAWAFVETAQGNGLVPAPYLADAGAEGYP